MQNFKNATGISIINFPSNPWWFEGNFLSYILKALKNSCYFAIFALETIIEKVVTINCKKMKLEELALCTREEFEQELNKMCPDSKCKNPGDYTTLIRFDL